MKKTKREFAELANHVIQCGSVTFNEADDKKDYNEFKLFCGKISNDITKIALVWNDEAESKFKLNEDILDELECFGIELEEVKKVHDKKKRKALRKALKLKFGKALKKEVETVDALCAFFSSEEELEFETFPLSKIPLNINGAYLDVIRDLLV